MTIDNSWDILILEDNNYWYLLIKLYVLEVYKEYNCVFPVDHTQVLDYTLDESMGFNSDRIAEYMDIENQNLLEEITKNCDGYRFIPVDKGFSAEYGYYDDDNFLETDELTIIKENKAFLCAIYHLGCQYLREKNSKTPREIKLRVHN